MGGLLAVLVFWVLIVILTFGFGGCVLGWYLLGIWVCVGCNMFLVRVVAVDCGFLCLRTVWVLAY